MQVTEKASHLTHAVINAGEQISFGVSDDPMFFHMMYSSLYGNPMLAAFREPLCNAWDANIDNGKGNVPLEITLTETSVTIKDSGKGIPHSQIGEIYLTLGKSTKVNQADQTGGFGLGCKAPFAYAEHFEVRSYHEGICTIYRMIKVCPENGGRPSATVIATFPTEETGLTVTIPFVVHGHDESGNPMSRDYSKIKKYLLRAISQGGILANVNGYLIPIIPLDSTPGAWAVGNNMGLSGETNHRLFVRYGSVVYPIERLEGLELHSRIREIVMNSFRGSSAEIVFQAPADSIVIPPNREAISAHPKTVTTLNEIFEKFIAQFDGSLQKVPGRVFDETVRTITKKNDIRFDMAVNATIKEFLVPPTFMDSSGYLRTDTVIKDTDSMVRASLLIDDTAVRKLDRKNLFRRLVIKAMGRSKILTTHHAASLCRLFMRHSHYDHEAYQNWIAQEIVKPLTRRLLRASLSLSHMFLTHSYNTSAKNMLMPYLTHEIYDFKEAVQIARKHLFISYNIQDVREKLIGSRSYERQLGGRANLFVYVCKSRAEGVRAREAFSKFRDFTVIDLTLARDQKDEENKRARLAAAKATREHKAAMAAIGITVEPASKAEKLPGFPSLANARDGSQYDFRKVKPGSENRVLEPRFWLKRPDTPPRKGMFFLNANVSRTETASLMSRFDTVGIMPTNKTQEKYIADKQLPEFSEYIQQVLQRALGNCKQIGNVRGLSVDKIVEASVRKSQLPYTISSMMGAILTDPWLCNHYGIKPYRSSIHVRRNLSTLVTLIQSGYLDKEGTAAMGDLRSKVEKPIVQKACLDLLSLVCSCKNLKHIDTGTLVNDLKHHDKGVRMQTRNFVINLLSKK